MMQHSNSSANSGVQDGEFFAYQGWRERFLRAVQYGALIFGLIALVPNILTAPGPGFIAIYLSAYIVLLLTTFVPLPYHIRAGGILFLLYALGTSGIVQDGLWGDARLFYLAFIGVSMLLYSPRVGIAATILSLGTLAAGAWALFSGQLRISNPEISIVGSPAIWITSITVLLLLAALFVSGLQLLQQEFSKARNQARQTVASLREERANLEQRVEERTAGLTRKTDQLRAASYIASQTAELQDLSALLNAIPSLITDQFGFYHTGIFLINETGDEAVLQAASSEGGRRMIEKGHTLSLGTQDVVGYVAARKRPRIALDVGTDAVFFNNPDLPMTRSEVALPLVIRNKVLGVLDIQSDKPQAFSMDDIDILQTLADQMAVAIENARLLDESQAAVMQLETLTGVRTREAWSRKLRERDRVFTYTPLGLRAEKSFQKNENTINASIILRGQKIGNISIARKDNVAWNKLDEEMVTEVANQVGLAVDNIRLLEEATQRARQEQTIGRLPARFGQSLDLDTLLQTATRELGQLPDVSEVSVFMGQQIDQDSPNKHLDRDAD